MIRGLKAAIATLLLCIIASSQAAEDHRRRFSAADLFDLQSVSDPQIRPDGHAIAYVLNSFDIQTDRPRQSVWLYDLASGERIPLQEPTQSGHSPRWSRDGRRLAYVGNETGEVYQLYVRTTQSSQSYRVTQLGDTPSDLVWSPDGASIAFMARERAASIEPTTSLTKPPGAHWAAPPRATELVRYRSDAGGYLQPGYRHVFVVSTQGGAVRQLTFGPFDDSGPVSWSADGRFIFVSSNRDLNWQLQPLQSDIYRVSVSDASMTALTHREGPNFAPLVSPDGKKIAYLGFEDRQLGYQNVLLSVMDVRDRTPTALIGNTPTALTATLDRSIDQAEWAHDGRSLYVHYVDSAIGIVARVFLDGHTEVVARGTGGSTLDRPYTGGEFSVSDEGTVALTSADELHPPELAIVRKRRLTRLTDLNDSLLNNRRLGAMRPLAVKSSADQRSVPSWLVLPPGFDPHRRYPLILEIHGGPFLSSYGPLFATDHQLFAGAGFVVLFCNPRGSTSYGEEFANLIHRDYPGKDYDDLMSAVDAAVSTGFVDPDRLFVTGSSGGGLLTAWIVGRTHRFRAAAPQKAMVNWMSQSLTTDMYTTIPRYWFGVLPWEDPGLFWKHSPLSLVANVTTPTLMVVGDRDYRTPLSESEQFYQALQLRGVPTRLLMVPGASHGSLASRPSQSAARISAILAWFNDFDRAGE